MALYEFEGKRPSIAPSTFVHPNAVIIGGVTIGAGCYIGAGAVLRGDWGDITVGEGSNIQENCIVHVRPDEVTTLGPSSHIGHGSILHGCTLGFHVLVGMGAILHDHVKVGDEVIIAAGSVIAEGVEIPAGRFVAGVPARVRADVAQEKKERIAWGTKLYQELPLRCHTSLRRID